MRLSFAVVGIALAVCTGFLSVIVVLQLLPPSGSGSRGFQSAARSPIAVRGAAVPNPASGFAGKPRFTAGPLTVEERLSALESRLQFVEMSAAVRGGVERPQRVEDDPLLRKTVGALKEDVWRVAKINDDRASMLFARLGGPATSGVYGEDDPVDATRNHVCRSPPCSRDLASCKLMGNCCVDRMFEMLSDVCDFLTAHDVMYFIIAGTLLGALREKDIIPHTSDLDIYVPREGWAELEKINQLHTPKGYYVARDPHDGHVSRLCAVWKGYPVNRGSFSKHFDWQTEKPGADLQYYLDVYDETNWKHANTLFYPLSTIKIRNKTFFAPREPERFVRAVYGESWKTPDNKQHAGEGNYPTAQAAKRFVFYSDD